MKDSPTFERIRMPSPEEFYARYMRTLTPVVITDLFANQPIASINTKERVIECWGEVEIPVEDEYGQAYLQAARENSAPSDSLEKTTSTTIAGYFDFVAKNPHTRKMCIEFKNPETFTATYRIPEVCRPSENDSGHFVHQCFIGNRGNVANVHFDKAGAHGFLYQVFGKKRFVIFPHSAAWKMAPFTQFSGWLLKNFSEDDRRAFLEFADGKETILDAGDCIYVPSYAWHFAEYVEDCMSISLRFRRSKIVTLLANAFFPDLYLQGIAYAMADIERAKTEHAALLAEIAALLARPYPDGKAKARAMRDLARDVYRRLYPDAPAAPYSIDLEEFFPAPLPHFLNFDDPKRPIYK